jgi:hypothetical protein
MEVLCRNGEGRCPRQEGDEPQGGIHSFTQMARAGTPALGSANIM